MFCFALLQQLNIMFKLIKRVILKRKMHVSNWKKVRKKSIEVSYIGCSMGTIACQMCEGHYLSMHMCQDRALSMQCARKTMHSHADFIRCASALRESMEDMCELVWGLFWHTLSIEASPWLAQCARERPFNRVPKRR